MQKYSALTRRQPIPQSEPLDETQVRNNAGGFVFALDDWARLERFLILGSDANSYYQKARPLTRENARSVENCWSGDPSRAAAVIADISLSGRAPKNDAAIFALAIGACYGLGKTAQPIDFNQAVAVRHYALSVLNDVCRTSTHLFAFVDNCRALGRGRGRAFNRALENWYLSKTVEARPSR